MRTVPHTLLPLFSHRRRTVKGAPTFSCQMVETKIGLALAAMRRIMMKRSKRMRRAKMQSSYQSAKRAFGSFCQSANNLDVQSIVRYPRTAKVRLFNLFWNDLRTVHNWQLDSFSLGTIGSRLSLTSFMNCHLHRSSSCGENDLHSRPPEQMVIMHKCWGEENICCINKCRPHCKHFPFRPPVCANKGEFLN